MELKYDEKSCGVVVFREEKGKRLYLLLNYPAGHWDFPKGHVEAEDLDEYATAKRELLEETGITEVNFIPDFREKISYTYKKGQQPSTKLVVFFIAETMQQNIKISFEHFAYKWLDYPAALSRLTFDNAKDLLKKAENFLNR